MRRSRAGVALLLLRPGHQLRAVTIQGLRAVGRQAHGNIRIVILSHHHRSTVPEPHPRVRARQLPSVAQPLVLQPRRCRGWRTCRSGHVVTTAVTRSGNVMVVLSLVGGDNCFDVGGSSLYVLPHWATHVRALVVAPDSITKFHGVRQALLHIFKTRARRITRMGWGSIFSSIPRMWVAFDHFLAILAPPIPIVKNIHIARCLHDHSRLSYCPWRCRCILRVIIPLPVNKNSLREDTELYTTQKLH